MRPLQQLRIATLVLRENRLRSFLAIGTVALGVASMMAMLAMSSGVKRQLDAITDRVGKNLFMVKAGTLRGVPGRGRSWFMSTTLTQKDVEEIAASVSGTRAVAPLIDRNMQAKHGGKEMVTSVKGVTPSFFTIRNFRVARGRAFDDFDSTSRARVAIVGRFIASKLSESGDLIGKTVWLSGVPFEVIGEFAEKGLSGDGSNEDDQILVPVETAQRRLLNVQYLSHLVVQVKDASVMEASQAATGEVLRRTHKLDRTARDDFEILSLISAEQIRRVQSEFVQRMTRILAAVTLILGGAGVLLVTYLNVVDRTAEVGLRRAIGAKRHDITFLFLTEACLLSTLGGFVGLLEGWASIELLQLWTKWQMVTDLRAIAIPFASALCLGIVFGVGPAIRASRLMPVQALNYA